jgi:hypothetical protein
MAFVSQAQRAYFHAHPELHRYIPEFEAATPKGKRLPQHVRGVKKRVKRRPARNP